MACGASPRWCGLNFFGDKTEFLRTRKRAQKYMQSNIKRSVLLFATTLLIGIGLFALDRMPKELFLFDIQTDALSFFRVPLDQFYISVFFSWIEWLRRAELLTLVLGALVLGALHEITREFPKYAWSTPSGIAAAHVLLFLFLLPKTSYFYEPSSGITLFLLALFFCIRVTNNKKNA